MFNKILALLCLSFSVTAQVTIEFKIKPGSGNTLNGSVEICNNSGSALPAGYYMDFYWPNFNIVDLTSQPGTVVYPGDGILRMQFNAAWMLPAAGACRSHSVNSTSTYDNPFLFPPYGIDSNGDTVDVVVTDPQWIPKSGQNEPQEFYIAQECFIPSPDQYCLGEARFEEWNRLADVRIPVNRKGWALAAAHSHRLFTNMMGCEVTSLNFVMATSMIEGRMGCDANAQPPAGDAHPLTYESHITTDGCLQIRPLGYLQTQDFYPHLFANTPKASITDGDNFITSALTKTLYDYTSFTFWDQYFCYPDVREFFCNLNDPYGADAIFGYTYHKGWNNTDFQKVFIDDRATWQNADNIADLLSTHHPDIHGGYAERVRNNIMRLENNFSVDPSLNYSTAQDNWDPSTYQHYGCYNEAFTWQDVSDYIDEALRVFITANETRVKTAAQDAFNMIAVGGEVNFQDIGPVIDAIVLNIPVPSANQGMTGKYFSQAETCIKPGIKIHSYDEICAGQDAELLVYLMGQPPFNYTIQGPDGTIYSRSGVGISTDVLNVNQPGEYKIISMSDANGDLDLKCNTARTEIQNAGNATAAWDKSRYDAADDCYEGDLELLLTGSGPWKVTYSKNGGADIVLNIPAGLSSYTVETPNEGDTYVLKSMVAGGCNSNLNDEITFCSSTQHCVAPQATVAAMDDTICSGDSTQINIDFVGVQPFSLVYSLNGNATKVENIMAWNYSINISESVNFRIDTLWDNQCMNDTLVDPATVTVVNPLQVDLGPDVFSCGDEVSLQVDSIFTDYIWVSHSGGDPSLLANQNGDYIINVIDSNGCASADTVNVQLGALPSVDIGDSIFVCDANLPFEIRNQGGQVDQYLWQDGSTDSVYQVISEGLVWLEINSGGCTARDSVMVMIQNNLNVDIGPDQVICPGGSAVFNANVTAQQFEWNGTIGQDTFATNLPGDVVLQVTDNDGCVASDTANVTIQNNLDVDIGPDQVICPGGSAVFNANVTAQQFEWNGTLGQDTFATSLPGEVVLQVTDSVGCLWSDTARVTIQNYLNIDIGPDQVICPGGSAVFNANVTAQQFEWNGIISQDTFATNLPGDVVLQVTDSVGCVGSDTANVTIQNNLNVDIGPDQVICPGGSAVFNANVTAQQFEWNGTIGQDTFATNLPGDVVLQVTDSYGCSGSDTARVDVENNLALDIDAQAAFCPGDSVRIGEASSRSGVIYSWASGENTSEIYVDASGTYVLAIDSAGCSVSDTVIVDQSAPPQPVLGNDTAFCTGQDINLLISPSQSYTSYRWLVDASGNDSEYIVNQAGVYVVEVEDDKGCLGRDTMEVSESNATPFSFSTIDTTICPGQALVLTVPLEIQSVGGNWQWGDGSNGLQLQLDSLQNDSLVHLTFWNSTGCASMDSIRILVRNEIPVQLSSDTACVGDNVVFNAPNFGAGFSYEWNNDPNLTTSSLSFENIQLSDAGSIHLRVESPLGCSGDTAVELLVFDVPAPSIENDTVCEGESVVFQSNVLGDYLWSNGTVGSTLQILNATLADAQEYTLEVTNSMGCIGRDTMMLVVNEIPEIEIVQPQMACEGAFVDLFTVASNNLPVRWSTNDTTDVLRVSSSGEYVASVSENGCAASDTVEVEFLERPEVYLPQDSVICMGTEWYIAPTNTLDYSVVGFEWSTNETTEGIVVETPGYYWLEVTNGACSDRDSVWVGQSMAPVRPFGKDTTLCVDEVDMLSLDAGRVNHILWNDGDTNQVKQVQRAGIYEVYLENEHGCYAEYSIEVISDCPSAVWLPNAFTPNDDGINETLIIQGRGVETVSLQVFNRWGEQIWEGNGIGDSWDGTYLGNMVQQDVYVYKLNYEYLNHEGYLKEKEIYGTVTVLVD